MHALVMDSRNEKDIVGSNIQMNYGVGMEILKSLQKLAEVVTEEERLSIDHPLASSRTLYFPIQALLVQRVIVGPVCVFQSLQISGDSVNIVIGEISSLIGK